MLRLTGAVVAVCALALMATAANASPLTQKHGLRCVLNDSRPQCWGKQKYRILSHRRAVDANGGDVRPRAWCGWWMRRHLGVSDRRGNLAVWWRGYGTNAHGPAIGALVVWPHHIGIITGRGEGGWIVLSGNDGHRVRERARSLRGAIAFRWPSRVASNASND